MKILIMEDEFTSRMLLQHLMSEYGEIDAVVNGQEALDAFYKAADLEQKYDLICLDIMVPEIDGQEVLRRIREFEEKNGIDGLNTRTKVVMITALNDVENFLAAFNEQCEGYIMKPFNREKIQSTMKSLNLSK